MTALRKPDAMTVAEFLGWEPDHDADRRWQLMDGVPACMAPATDNHARIQAEAAYLLTAHLRAHRPGCSVLVAPGVIPRISSLKNYRIPDLGVTCAPASGGQSAIDPILLIEILSPSNAAITRDNVWAYTTTPSVSEILLLDSLTIAGELLRRENGGAWPAEPLPLARHDAVSLNAIGFSAKLEDFYRTTNLASES